MFRESCLVCGFNNLKEIIDLGMHPFADTFVPKENLSSPDYVYPLICDLCDNCGQVQLRCITNPKDRYCKIDYSYTSSNSSFSREHWENYAKDVIEKTKLVKNNFVVEIGSNDGFLTNKFADYGCKVLGVDPSDYMAKLAEERDVETLTELFEKNTSYKIIEKFGKANLILANNVFNHSDDPLEFAKGVKNLLTPGGTFVFELPYWKISVESSKFDQIYHEHVSYFSSKSAAQIIERAGMRIYVIEIINYHGGSLRVYAKKQEDVNDHCEELYELIKKEENFGLFNVGIYEELMNRLNSCKNNFLKKIYEIKASGASIIAIGAAAKGNTFLNFYNLNNRVIDFVTDSSPYKQGKYTPLTRIPIKSDEIFVEYIGRKIYALILSWNIANILKPIVHKINPGVIFISPENF